MYTGTSLTPDADKLPLALTLTPALIGWQAYLEAQRLPDAASDNEDGYELAANPNPNPNPNWRTNMR